MLVLIVLRHSNRVALERVQSLNCCLICARLKQNEHSLLLLLLMMLLFLPLFGPQRVRQSAIAFLLCFCLIVLCFSKQQQRQQQTCQWKRRQLNSCTLTVFSVFTTVFDNRQQQEKERERENCEGGHKLCGNWAMSQQSRLAYSSACRLFFAFAAPLTHSLRLWIRRYF